MCDCLGTGPDFHLELWPDGDDLVVHPDDVAKRRGHVVLVDHTVTPAVTGVGELPPGLYHFYSECPSRVWNTELRSYV